MAISALPGYVLSTQTGTATGSSVSGGAVYDLSTLSGLQSVQQFIDVSSYYANGGATLIAAAKAMFAGDTHNLTGSTTGLTTTATDGSGGAAGARYQIHFSFNDFGSQTATENLATIALALGLDAADFTAAGLSSSADLSNLTEDQFIALFTNNRGNL